MPVDSTKLLAFFDNTLPSLIGGAIGKDLPLIGTVLENLPLDQLKSFASIESAIETILNNNSTAQDIANAIKGLQIDGLTATANGAVVNIGITAQDSKSVALADTGIHVHEGNAFTFDATANFDGQLKASGAINLALDTSTGDVSIADSSNVHAEFDVMASNVAATAELGGLIGATVTDTDETDPLVTVSADLKFAGGAPQTPTVGVNIDDHFKILTTKPDLFDSPDATKNPLPNLFADLHLTWDVPDLTAGNVPAPDFYFQDFGIDISSILNMIEDAIGPVADFFSHFPFAQIIDGLSDPIPVIGPLLTELGKLDPQLKGPIPLPNGDDVFNMLDVIALKIKSDALQDGTDPTAALTALSAFAIGFSVIQYLEKIHAPRRKTLARSISAASIFPVSKAKIQKTSTSANLFSPIRRQTS